MKYEKQDWDDSFADKDSIVYCMIQQSIDNDTIEDTIKYLIIKPTHRDWLYGNYIESLKRVINKFFPEYKNCMDKYLILK